jgi:DNA-binding PadR family transcriptional regulator
MERRGLVRAHWVKAGKLRQRKHYKITAKGLAEFRERKQKWRQFRGAMDRVLGG